MGTFISIWCMGCSSFDVENAIIPRIMPSLAVVYCDQCNKSYGVFHVQYTIVLCVIRVCEFTVVHQTYSLNFSLYTSRSQSYTMCVTETNQNFSHANRHFHSMFLSCAHVQIVANSPPRKENIFSKAFLA